MTKPIFVVVREGQTTGIVFTNRVRAWKNYEKQARKYPGKKVYFCPSIDAIEVDLPELAPIKPLRIGP